MSKQSKKQPNNNTIMKEKKLIKYSNFLCYLLVNIFLFASCENNDPYSEGLHWNYKIIYENGFVYKQVDRGCYQIFNSDGKPLKAGKKIY